MALRNDLKKAATEDRNRTTSDGAGAYLVIPRAAVEALIFYLRRQDQFVERALRGADGLEMVATLLFDGQVSAGCPPSSAIHDVHICFGLDKGGLISSCKAVLTCANQLHPSSRGNSILYGLFPCEKDNRAAFACIAEVYVPDLDDLRTGGVDVSGSRRAVTLIKIGEYAFMTSWVGHEGASILMPCLWCTALRRRTQQNGLMVDKWGNMQNGSRARGVPRTRDHFDRMAVAYTDGNNRKRGSPMPLEENLSIESRPLLIIDPTHVSPMPLHLTLGITGSFLRLGIEAVYFNEGPERASAYAMNLSMTLRFGVGVTPKPYFGRALEGRQCQTIARRLSSVVELLASYVPAEEAAAYSAACHTWAEHLPVLTRTGDSSTEDVTAFQAGTARFVDGLCRAFPWFTVTHKLHVLCCHASKFLRRFGSLGRYSEQGLEVWDEEGGFGELLEAEFARLLALLQDQRLTWPEKSWTSSTTTVLPPPPPMLRRG